MKRKPELKLTVLVTIQIMSRLAVTSSIAILSTQLLMLFSSIAYMVCLYRYCEQELLTAICDGFWGIDCFINNVCIFLSYDFGLSTRLYYRVCCCCDNFCFECCKLMSQKRMENQNQLNMSLLSSSQSIDL